MALSLLTLFSCRRVGGDRSSLAHQSGPMTVLSLSVTWSHCLVGLSLLQQGLAITSHLHVRTADWRWWAPCPVSAGGTALLSLATQPPPSVNTQSVEAGDVSIRHRHAVTNTLSPVAGDGRPVLFTHQLCHNSARHLTCVRRRKIPEEMMRMLLRV